MAVYSLQSHLMSMVNDVIYPEVATCRVYLCISCESCCSVQRPWRGPYAYCLVDAVRTYQVVQCSCSHALVAVCNCWRDEVNDLPNVDREANKSCYVYVVQYTKEFRRQGQSRQYNHTGGERTVDSGYLSFGSVSRQNSPQSILSVRLALAYQSNSHVAVSIFTEIIQTHYLYQR